MPEIRNRLCVLYTHDLWIVQPMKLQSRFVYERAFRMYRDKTKVYGLNIFYVDPTLNKIDARPLFLSHTVVECFHFDYVSARQLLLDFCLHFIFALFWRWGPFGAFGVANSDKLLVFRVLGVRSMVDQQMPLEEVKACQGFAPERCCWRCAG